MTSLNLSIAGKVETANTIQNYFQPASTKFITLTNSSPYFAKVEKVIRESLAPFYGSQDSSIEKIKESKDRKSELLLYNDNPVGLIVYKKEKQDAFSIYGIRDSFELKTFLVIDQERNAEKGYDTLLLNRVLKLARGKFATSVHLTAPEQYDAEFFSSKGFSIARTWKDKYIQGVTEHLLYLDLPKNDVIKIKKSRPEAIEEGKINKSKRKRSISPQTTQEVQDSKKLRKKRKALSVKPRKSLHHLTMKKKYIHQMRSGLKTVEGRIFNRSVPKFQCGDKLRFYYLSNASDDLTCKITNIKRFPSFREMLVDSGVKACLPDANNLEEAVLAYDQIPKYKEKAEKFGVAAIHVTPILQ